MIRSLVFLTILLFVLPLHLSEPIYSRNCRKIKNRRGKVVEIKCVEKFKTNRRPPLYGLHNHKSLNEFLALDGINSNTSPSWKEQNGFTTTAAAVTRPTISPNPNDNEIPDYTNLWTTTTQAPVRTTSTSSLFDFFSKKPTTEQPTTTTELSTTTTTTATTTEEPSTTAKDQSSTTTTKSIFSDWFKPKTTVASTTEEVTTAKITTTTAFTSSREILDEHNYDEDYEDEETAEDKNDEKAENDENDEENEENKSETEKYEYE